MSFDWEKQKAANEAATKDPQRGDHWCEMLSYHVIVVHRAGEIVITAECPGGSTLPGDGKWTKQTVSEFSARMHYKSDPKIGCWADIMKRGKDMSWAGSASSVMRRIALQRVAA